MAAGLVPPDSPILRGMSDWNAHLMPGPGEQARSASRNTRREPARRAGYEARPEVARKRAEDAASRARREAARNAKRKHPKLVQSTDYPWLKPDWVEAPVRPFKRR